ncbi:MAG: hypothetical protein K6E91_11120 [Butyrivibrio sp.]|nr:hypothetical protein [Butyrivibrio sp.]
MFKSIKLQDYKGEDIEVEMLANAATPLRYKMMFRKDLLTQFANAKTEDGKAINLDVDFISELAFIMAMQAKALNDSTIKLDALSFEMYLKWLEQLDSFTIESNGSEIVGVYAGNNFTSSEAKKNTDEQSGN